MPNGQHITIDGTNSGQTFTGDNNTYLMSVGAWTLGVNGMANQISGGSGPNTYLINSTATAFNVANGLTTGSGGSTISITGNWTEVNVPNAQTTHTAIVGSNDTVTTGDGAASVVAFGDHNMVNGGNSSDNFLLSGQANAVLLGNGTSAVGLQGDGLVNFQGGTKTFSFLAGSSSTGPTIAPNPITGGTFNPATDHIAVLLGTTFYAGLTDVGLSPQAFLNPALFTEGSAPATSNTRFLYNPSTGLLSFTPLGSDSAARAPIANLPAGLTMDGSNIFIANRYVYGAPVQNALDSLPGAWNVTDPLPTAPNADNFGAADTSDGVSSEEPGMPYPGPVVGLQNQFIYQGTHRVSVSARTDNVFIKGAGNEALASHGGNNVLDGGKGSNFLVGAGGTDTFFTDARTPQFVWNTVVNFHPGEIVTVFGYVDGVSSRSISASEGAAGFQGLTVNMDVQGTGQTTAKVTLTGLTTADLGHLAFTTGNVGGIPYLAINNT